MTPHLKPGKTLVPADLFPSLREVQAEREVGAAEQVAVGMAWCASVGGRFA